MTVSVLAVGQRLRTPQDLCAALGIGFSEQQLAAATAPMEPGVIVAGAGSGKTTVMAARVVWLVGTGQVKPEQVLGLTFTRKAAGELSGRIRAALVRAGVVAAQGVDTEGQQVVMTYDAFAARLVSEHGLRVGVEGDPAMLTGAARFRLASRVVAAAAGPFEHLSRLRPDSVTERVLALDAEMQAHLVPGAALHAQARRFAQALEVAPLNNRRAVYASVRAARVAAEERLELAGLVREYQALKRRLGYVEFADQMEVAARLATDVPVVSARLREQFAVVLLDEYQDTSSAQAMLLRSLFSGTEPASGLGHPITAVGDPFQAIYGWRGAAASNILAFSSDFPRQDGRPAARFALTVNRRSGQGILDAANALAEPLRSDPLLAYDLSDTLLRAPRDAAPGEVWVASFDAWPDEVAFVADEIVAAQASGRVPAWREIAVLSRRNADLAEVFSALRAREVPVEIVGLGGLLGLPEVADVVATLRLIDDVTANEDALRLLTGPRWAIGPGDLALLGRRSAELARLPVAPEGGLEAALEHAVGDVDPTDAPSLLEAAGDLGTHPFSAAARGRLTEFAAEFESLRRHAAEPVLDLVHRVVATLGLDAELGLVAPDGRRQLATFIDAVADYVGVDGEASLAGLLAYLRAELEHGMGLEQAVPSEANSVKLLTIHKAKGLEWDLVFLPNLAEKVFPSERVTANWVRSAATVPAELRGDSAAVPQVRDVSDAGFQDYRDELAMAHQRAEDRLAYVAVTRARRLVVGSCHTWRVGLATPRSPSRYLTSLWSQAATSGNVKAQAPAVSGPNPAGSGPKQFAWPAPLDPEALSRRRAAATAVEEARAALRCGDEAPDDWLLLDEAEAVAGWDLHSRLLLAEAHAATQARRSVELPVGIATTALVGAARDPEGYAARLARPMPRPPSRRAWMGTRFHEWIQRRYGQGALVDVDDDDDDRGEQPDSEKDFSRLCAAFEAGRFASLAPLATEAAFTLPLAGQLIRGRIDAVYAGVADHDFLVVDWKTGWREAVDPLQLAIYRLAWADLRGVDIERVAAGFYFVRSDELVLPSLPDRAGLAEVVTDLTRR